VTVPVAVEGVQPPPPAAGEPPAAADSAGALAAAVGATVPALPPPLQAATRNNVTVPRTRISRFDMVEASSRQWVRASSRGIDERYDAIGRPVS
jgi:hypothetical protein